MVEDILEVWKAILKVEDITDDTDFFSMGAGSMDVVRLVEEVKDKAGKIVLEWSAYVDKGWFRLGLPPP